MVLPNFLIIGTPKAGTTSIYHYLNQHPEIYFSPKKEPHFFSFIGEQKPHWGVQTLAEYEKLFEGVTNEKAIGEASSWYLYSQSAAEQIKKYIPDVKLIIILRNPAERAYSSWVFRCEQGWENINNFQKAIAMEAERIKNGEPWDYHYLNTGFYYQQIKRYLKYFNEKQLAVYLYEDFKKEPSETLKNIFQFLQVDNKFESHILQRHNITSSAKNLKLQSLIKNNQTFRNIVKRYVPNSLAKNIKSMVLNINTIKKVKISLELKREFILIYKEDIDKLQSLINHDLSGWLNY